ncbi:helix-hairpin-helix domain-containing protein [Listeria ivanovii]|uniref:helix-hairpin-helix domain-containing protein n=1 Tax=Listeria ivanovii TaxID=1638 RepID=UPI00051271A7|nr:helix-hairpin-helix domain-containing protein [Listeria ivanovii]AIS64017.1 competence protein ComEA [Listeria ivanovii subsp. londoniensis]MBK1967298.1 helix-hairpin-helix domain-containing protein [Listeria ivanovii subsp. londoniensis]MBK1985236.1 helix-hairpin-helix domain-containing protein [Listeria ivanovii subsp. londoniensis]MBK1996590.1 helix-hairpin-helix domain-containing protein [Listeria ivanovii subsp. londoniensis]
MIEQIKKLKNYILIIVAVIFAGLVYLCMPDKETEEVTTNAATIAEVKADTEQVNEAKYVYIDIKGAVRSPGVYKLPLDARVQDVVKTAGGLTEEAESSKLNLAEKLKDEMSIYVYKKGEQGSETSTSRSEQAGEKTEEKININTASTSNLQTVPGIGESKATAIIEYREKEGLFQTIEDLQNVTGIGEKTIEKLKEYLDVK